MKVRALKSFGGTTAGGRYHVTAGEVIEMPEGVDWIEAGLVEPVEAQTAAVKKGGPRDTTIGTQPVTEIDGIGPATAETLAKEGVTTVADLAAAHLPEKYHDFQHAARILLSR